MTYKKYDPIIKKMIVETRNSDQHSILYLIREHSSTDPLLRPIHRLLNLRRHHENDQKVPEPKMSK